MGGDWPPNLPPAIPTLSVITLVHFAAVQFVNPLFHVKKPSPTSWLSPLLWLEFHPMSVRPVTTPARHFVGELDVQLPMALYSLIVLMCQTTHSLIRSTYSQICHYCYYCSTFGKFGRRTLKVNSGDCSILCLKPVTYPQVAYKRKLSDVAYTLVQVFISESQLWWWSRWHN